MENYLHTLGQFTCTLKLDFSLAVVDIKGNLCTLRPREALTGSINDFSIRSKMFKLVLQLQ